MLLILPGLLVLPRLILPRLLALPGLILLLLILPGLLVLPRLILPGLILLLLILPGLLVLPRLILPGLLALPRLPLVRAAGPGRRPGTHTAVLPPVQAEEERNGHREENRQHQKHRGVLRRTGAVNVIQAKEGIHCQDNAANGRNHRGRRP